MRTPDWVQIRLTELQIDMQSITAEYQTAVAMIYSVMIALVVFLLAIAIQTMYLGWVVIVLIVTLATFLTHQFFIEPKYSREKEAIKKQIQELKKECW